jgi:hypothetical protein
MGNSLARVDTSPSAIPAERKRILASDSPNHVGADGAGPEDWRRFGPFTADRQHGTVRESYAADGECWGWFSHDDARSRAYRWGEDALLGYSDRNQVVNFSLACWNGKDPVVKERLFGLTNDEGPHGEDVKEVYYYTDATPTASYLSATYRYPMAEYPYVEIVGKNLEAKTRLFVASPPFSPILSCVAPHRLSSV